MCNFRRGCVVIGFHFLFIRHVCYWCINNLIISATRRWLDYWTEPCHSIPMLILPTELFQINKALETWNFVWQKGSSKIVLAQINDDWGEHAKDLFHRSGHGVRSLISYLIMSEYAIREVDDMEDINLLKYVGPNYIIVALNSWSKFYCFSLELLYCKWH
jgi:hypothetical protein